MIRSPSLNPEKVIGKDDLVGSLRVASLFDICQFLLLTQKSGTLTLFRRGGTSRLYFDRGQIINAMEEREGRQGLDAALRTLRIQEGGFRFRVEEPGTARLIEDSTQNLLLEAARKMDEMENARPPGEREGSGTSYVEEVQLRQEQGEAIRELFSSIEEEVASEEDAAPLEKLLEGMEEARGGQLHLEEGKPPIVLRGGRVLCTFRGRVRIELIEDVRKKTGDSAWIDRGNQHYQVEGNWTERRVTLKRLRRPPTLQEANLIPEQLDPLLECRPGIILLVGDPPEVRYSLHEAVVLRLGERGDVAVTLGEWNGPTGKGLIVPHPYPTDDESRRSLLSLIHSLEPSKIGIPEIRSAADCRFLLDLARCGWTVLATLPGKDGGDAIRRVAGWFRSNGTLRSLSALLIGIVAIKLVAAGESGRAVPITSIAPWGTNAGLALAKEDFLALPALLEDAAAGGGFQASLKRLMQAKKIGEEEARMFSSLLPAPAET